MKNKYKIIVLFGESGAGKDTIQTRMSSLFPKVLNPIISCTTRPKRDYEVDGIDYHFLSEHEIKEMISNGDMLEYAIFNNWYYGTGLISLDPNKINIGVFNLQGLESLINRDDVELFPVYVHACGKTRLLRNLKRENSPDCREICRRYLADEKEFYSAYDIAWGKDNDFTEKFLGIPVTRLENEEDTSLTEKIYDCKPLMDIIEGWTKELNLV